MRRRRVAVRPVRPVLTVLTVLTVLSALVACGRSAPPAPPAPQAATTTPQQSAASTRQQSGAPARGVPRWDHVVVVVEENHSYDAIIGSGSAPYLAQLASLGTLFTNSFAITHPSQPNYLALFSGSTQGVAGDDCPNSYGGDNLGQQLRAAGYSFTGFAEDLPGVGVQTCSAGSYARKHAPWTDFADLPATVSQPFTAFPADFTKLPTVSFVIPNLDNDMHDGSIAQGDGWLRSRLGSFATWAAGHHSLLLVTWDEDDDTNLNQVPTIAVGSGVPVGHDSQRVTHYSVLRTVEDAYGLAPLGAAAQAAPITALGG